MQQGLNILPHMPGAGGDTSHNPNDLPPTPSAPASHLGFLMVRNNEQIEEAARIARQENETKLKEPQIDSLAAHVLSCWNEAKTNKENNIEVNLIDSWRRRKGEYSPEKLASIVKSGQSPIFMKITEVKCNAFEAWFNDIVTANTDRLWALSPTPVPDMPEEVGAVIVQRVMQIVMEQLAGGQKIPIEQVFAMSQKMREDVMQEYKADAEARCRKMETVIHDILSESNWEQVNNEAVEHLATFGTCIVKGPIVRQEQRLAWDGGRAIVRPDYVIQFEAVHPLNFYPAPTATKIDENYMIEFVEISRRDLHALKDHPGYNRKEIELLLAEHSTGGLRKYRDLDISRLNLSDNSEAYQVAYSDVLQGLEYYGPISGRLLKEWGVKGISDESADYEVECIMFGNHVIRAVVNDNPLGCKPYSKSTFKPRSGSFWGQSIAELMEDVQDVCNGAARALVRNMGVASGPMMAIDDIARIPEGMDLTSIHPLMILQFNGDRTSNKDPVKWFSPDSHAPELVAIYERFMREADDRTGIPAYSYGSDKIAGAGKTASGLSMLMQSAARGIKKAITDWDYGVVTTCLARLYQHLMLYHPDPSIKGDAQVTAKGALGVFAREQLESNLQQLLGETANEIDMGILGVMGRAELLRRRFRLVDRDLERLVPSNEELVQRAEMEAAAVQQQQQQMAEQEQMAEQQTPPRPRKIIRNKKG